MRMQMRVAGVCVVVLYTVRLHAGVEVDLLTTKADLSIWGATSADRITGSAIGDLDGDGNPDLVIAQSNWRDPVLGSVGRVCVFWGPSAFPLEHDLALQQPPLCITGTSAVSFSLGAAGLHTHDLDGDGIADLQLAAGTTREAGGVAVFRGRRAWPPSMSVADADWRFIGAQKQDQLQDSVVGDLNGDGAPDLVLLAVQGHGPGTTMRRAGEAYVFFGPATSWTKRVYDLQTDLPATTIYGATDGDNFGWFAAIGDVTGSILPDLVVGAPALGPAPGNVYVFAGRSFWPRQIDTLSPGAATLTVLAPAPVANLGTVALVDWNRDGRQDLLLGAPSYSTPVTFAGGLFVIYGRNAFPAPRWDLSATPAEATILGPRPSAFLGYSLDSGDVNGDGYTDIVAGASSDPQPASRNGAGSVLVISGCPAPQAIRDLATEPADLSIYGAHASDSLGFEYCLAVRDLDFDGRADIFTAAPNSKSLMNARPAGSSEAHVVLGRSFAGPLPADLGNTLLAARQGSEAELSWTLSPGSLTYSLLRGTAKGVWPALPIVTQLTGTTVRRTDVAGPPDLYFYRVAGVNCAGEGP